MRKLEVEHCDLIHSHSDTIRQIQERSGRAGDQRLADFLRYLSDCTTMRINTSTMPHFNFLIFFLPSGSPQNL